MPDSKKNCIIRNGTRHAKRNSRKCRLEDNLQTKVLKFPPSSDKEGRCIYYCDYSAHQGLALRPDICESRECTHYHKFYLTKETQVYEKKKD